MSILRIPAEEREAVEAEFAKMQEAGTLPGGVMLGTPLECEDGSACYVDSRWDGVDEVTKLSAIDTKVAELVADEKTVVSLVATVSELPRLVSDAEIVEVPVVKELVR